MDDGEAAALVVEYDHRSGEATIAAYTPLADVSSSSVTLAYLSACDEGIIPEGDLYHLSHTKIPLDSFLFSQSREFSVPSSRFSPAFSGFISLPENLDYKPIYDIKDSTYTNTPPVESFAAAKKKYKPVALKVRPLLSELPEKFRIVRNLTGDPLADLPPLNPRPPTEFIPGTRYTTERREELRARHAKFLWPTELDLLDDMVKNQEGAFAWTDLERGKFKSEYFPPVEMPTVEHKPWVLKNIPIPPGIYREVCEQIKRKIAAGVYESSNSAYRSRWFTVAKKDGKPRIVHSLEPLNAVTIQHSGVPPVPEHLVERFAGRACIGVLDLYVGYDERELAECSRDLTTFQTPFGAHRLTTLPMGWTNSVPIFHDDVTYILQEEIPDYTVPYVDDVPLRGPETVYKRSDGTYETIAGNSGIRRFVWEHFKNVNRILNRMRYAGGTFSGPKAVIIDDDLVIIGHRCTSVGRLPDDERVRVVRNWSKFETLSDVRAFLGTIGVARIFIKNFAKRANALVHLTRKDVPFEFGEEQWKAVEDLREALLESPALRPIDYESEAPVILGVDTSSIAVGYLLCQQDLENPKIRYYNRFGSITLNDRESRFSQPKLELYGLFRALRALKFWLIGLRPFIVELDARYVKGMLLNPDLEPSAAINRWIMAILMFRFEIVHVPGERHAPDGLSRRPRQPGDPEPEDDGFDDWIDRVHGLLHLVNHPVGAEDVDRQTAVPQMSTEPLAVFVLGNPQQAAPAIGETPSYEDFPRSERAKRLDGMVPQVREFLDEPKRPSGLSDKQWKGFYKFASQFLLDARGVLWKRHHEGLRKLVVEQERRPGVLVELHDRLGHRGTYATASFACERFWWPDIKADVHWFVKTCLVCQMRQTTHVLIPPTVPVPLSPMMRVHADSMMMPGRYKYFVHARCATTSWPEGRALTTESAKTIGEWLFQDILSRWGALSELVTDNGAPWIKACDYLAKKYHIHHIRISGYNSRANGIVERPHFSVRDALVKAAGDDATKWHAYVHTVLWSERATRRRRFGCSPYFAITGSHPVLPLDFTEATYLVPPPESLLSTSELIAQRAIALQKRSEDVAKLRSKIYETRVREAREFEAKHRATIRDFDHKPRTMVLLRNTAIEKSLNKKTRRRFLGPYVVVSRNRGGAYVLAELDGTVFDRPVAAFRVHPFFARKEPIDLPLEWLDTDPQRLRELEASEDKGEGAEDAEEDEEDGEQTEDAEADEQEELDDAE